MRLTEKILLIVIFVTALLAGGGLYYAEQCWNNMRFVSFDGPQAASAADTKYTCGMHPMIIQDEPGTCPICGMNLTPMKEETAGGGDGAEGEKKIKYWVAPMDPTYIRDEPGKSPMGMDLVPVYEGESPSGPTIRIDPVTAQNMGVRTAPVEVRDLSQKIRTVGTVGYEEPRQYSVNSKIGGWIEKLYVNETGREIKRGEPLLEIYSPELVAAQEEYLLALQNQRSLSDSGFPEISAGAGRLLEASRQRLKYWDISDRQIERLRRSGKARKTLTLHSPYDGIVTEKSVHEGMRIESGKELFQISDISRVWVIADIYEYELPWVRKGQEAVVELPYQPGRALSGEVTYIYPYVDEKTRTVKVRLEFDNPSYELKPDQYVNVKLAARTVEDAMVIPREAILHSGDRRTVFIALGDGKFEPRQVEVGLSGADGLMQIEQGVMEGERVVTSSQFLLDSESRLREAIQKMLEPQEGEPAAEEVREDPDEEIEDLFDEQPDDGKQEEEDLDELF
ncbi:MAG: efflux RND transporter periplasmic adaptor subunit [Desulfuromonadales bacterium]|nr:efflux RND transporter periplasmic adaptor subunit [Desulfuromonadales bacterium]NIR34247.1 efflux RND transporter periplasmic adaptor subunit [Desulfuromonadales bacterium]NIS44234.1 efflux RND transporter periplasmic adaptor subunit [Desulfuromonadales bacterium]